MQRLVLLLVAYAAVSQSERIKRAPKYTRLREAEFNESRFLTFDFGGGSPSCHSVMVDDSRIVTTQQCASQSDGIIIGAYDLSALDISGGLGPVGEDAFFFPSLPFFDICEFTAYFLFFVPINFISQNARSIRLAQEQADPEITYFTMGWGYFPAPTPAVVELFKQCKFYTNSSSPGSNNFIAFYFDQDQPVAPFALGSPLYYTPKRSERVFLAGLLEAVVETPECGRVLEFSDVPLRAERLLNFNGGICFPADAEVTTAAGNKPMSQLLIGDKVLTADTHTSELYFTDVIGFLDNQPDIEASYVEIDTGAGQKLQLSPDHMLFVRKAAGREAIKARHVRVGDDVFTHVKEELRASRVRTLRLVTSRGAISPLTAAGTLLVQGTLASNYAYVDAHDFIHAIFAPWRALYSLQQWLAEPSTQPQQGIAPYPRLLKALFGSYVHQYFGNSPAFV